MSLSGLPGFLARLSAADIERCGGSTDPEGSFVFDSPDYGSMTLAEGSLYLCSPMKYLGSGNFSAASTYKLNSNTDTFVSPLLEHVWNQMPPDLQVAYNLHEGAL